jgi:mono/diheme cytochrome c family protein
MSLFGIAVVTRRALLFVSLIVGVAIASNQIALAAPPARSPEDGQAAFSQKCVACHTIGEGDLLGPDLAGVATRRDQEWLTRWLLAPDEVLAQGDAIATDLLKKYDNLAMPNLKLTEAEVSSLIAYLAAPDSVTPAPEGQPAPKGDPAVGKSHFTGTKRLLNGGPACIACHSITGIGAFGGGALGPDLTGAYARLGDALITWPESVLPMQAIYSEKPLTADERANLLAFVQDAAVAQRPTQAVWQLAGLAVAGVAILLGLSHVIWRQRIHKVRQPMVARQRTRG